MLPHIPTLYTQLCENEHYREPHFYCNLTDNGILAPTSKFNVDRDEKNGNNELFFFEKKNNAHHDLRLKYVYMDSNCE